MYEAQGKQEKYIIQLKRDFEAMASVARGAAGDLPAMELEDRVVAAAGAAVASALITNPMDVVKTRLQYQAAQINRFNTTQRGSGNVQSQNISMHAKKPASPKQQHYRSHGVPLPRLGSSSGQLSNLSCGCVVAEAGACVSHVGRAPASCGVFSGTLDAARKIVGLPHQGAYPEIGQAYQKLAILCGARNLWPKGFK